MRCLLCERTISTALDWWTWTAEMGEAVFWLGICLPCQDDGVDPRLVFGRAWDKLVWVTPTATARPSSMPGAAS
jgi:hypothetical protein